MPGALEQDDWHAGSRRCVLAICRPPSPTEIDAIQTMRGGYGSAQMIPLLDFEAIAETPKFFVGLRHYGAARCASRSHRTSDVLRPEPDDGRSPSPSPLTLDRFLQVLAGETTGPVPEDRDRLTVISIAGGRGDGRLVGGCLGDFIYTIGTPWEPRLDGAIFFFEDVGNAPIRIDRALLSPSRRSASSRAFEASSSESCRLEWYEFTSAPRSKTLEDVLGDRLGGSASQRFTDLPLGHGASLATLPLGVEATVDADALALTIDEPALEPPDGARPARRSAAAFGVRSAVKANLDQCKT